MRKISLLIFMMAIYTISFSVEAADEFCTQKEINRAVQLQDNGWLKILEQYVEEITPEEFYRGDEQSIKLHKDAVKLGLNTENIRQLNVKIQFLKPCVATTEWDEYVKKHGRNPDDPNELIPLTGEKGECFALLFKSWEAHEQGNKEKKKELIEKTAKQCPDIMEYMFPRFQCDYRLKVFLTQFSLAKFKRYELNTYSSFPQAPYKDSAGSSIKRKTEMLPGETMWVKFYLTGNPTSWCVWVPK